MNKTLKLIVSLFVIAIPSYLGFILAKNWHHKQIDTAMERSRLECFDVIRQLEKEMTFLKEEIARYSPPDIPLEKISSVFGTDRKPDALGNEAVDCKENQKQIKALFKYFDQKRYLPKYGISDPFELYFDKNIETISAHLPILSDELEDIYLLIKNVTHFYRTLGKKNIMLFKEIEKEESEIIEPALAVLFQWGGQCRSKEYPNYNKITLETLYAYSAFFLNTMSGRSYSLRRESKLRMLTNYYSLRILDISNDEKLNRLGIDIRPYIDLLFYDISNQKGLIFRERYLSFLAALQNKYQ